MNKRELLQILKDAGYWLERNGTVHAQWTNGQIRIAVPYHNKVDYRLSKLIRVQIRKNRAIKYR